MMIRHTAETYDLILVDTTLLKRLVVILNNELIVWCKLIVDIW